MRLSTRLTAVMNEANLILGVIDFEDPLALYDEIGFTELTNFAYDINNLIGNSDSQKFVDSVDEAARLFELHDVNSDYTDEDGFGYFEQALMAINEPYEAGYLDEILELVASDVALWLDNETTTIAGYEIPHGPDTETGLASIWNRYLRRYE